MEPAFARCVGQSRLPEGPFVRDDRVALLLANRPWCGASERLGVSDRQALLPETRPRSASAAALGGGTRSWGVWLSHSVDVQADTVLSLSRTQRTARTRNWSWRLRCCVSLGWNRLRPSVDRLSSWALYPAERVARAFPASSAMAFVVRGALRRRCRDLPVKIRATCIVLSKSLRRVSALTRRCMTWQ